MLAHADPGTDAAAGGVVATLGRPDGPALTVRTVTKADVDGLDALFQGLSDDDRHHRFFSLRPPARKFLEQMTQAEAEGGYRLVAVVPGAENQLVAEAGYALPASRHPGQQHPDARPCLQSGLRNARP